MGSSPVVGSRPSPALPLHLLVVAAVALTAAGGVTVADAATFVVTNTCPFPVWPAAIPAGDGAGGLLEPGETWVIKFPAGTTSGRIWGRTDCHFDGEHGACATGDCAGALSCQLSGKPPATLAEFTLAAAGGVDGAASDFYDVSVVDGFNLPMDFTCEDKAAGGQLQVPIRCGHPGCAGTNRRPGEGKVRTCTPGSDYRVVFCPEGY